MRRFSSSLLAVFLAFSATAVARAAEPDVGRKRVKWSGWDFAITVGPLAVWGALMMYDDSGKSLSNVLEALIIGVVAPIAPVVRVAAGEKMNQKRGALALLSVMCVVAFSLWALMPSLPE